MNDKQEQLWLSEINDTKPRNTRIEPFRTGNGTINEARRNRRPKKPKKHEGNISRTPNLVNPHAEYLDVDPPIETRHIHKKYTYQGFSFENVEKCKTPNIRHFNIHRMHDNNRYRDPIRKFKLHLDDLRTPLEKFIEGYSKNINKA